jgi:hypothetical protein
MDEGKVRPAAGRDTEAAKCPEGAGGGGAPAVSWCRRGRRGRAGCGCWSRAPCRSALGACSGGGRRSPARGWDNVEHAPGRVVRVDVGRSRAVLAAVPPHAAPLALPAPAAHDDALVSLPAVLVAPVPSRASSDAHARRKFAKGYGSASSFVARGPAQRRCGAGVVFPNKVAARSDFPSSVAAPVQPGGKCLGDDDARAHAQSGEPGRSKAGLECPPRGALCLLLAAAAAAAAAGSGRSISISSLR